VGLFAFVSVCCQRGIPLASMPFLRLSSHEQERAATP
jgi:hypothetical protein